MDIGPAGATLIVRRITRIVDDRLCGPIVPATAATGAIAHPTTVRQTIGHRDPDVPEILPAALRRADQFRRADRARQASQSRLAGPEHRVNLSRQVDQERRGNLRTPIRRSLRRMRRPHARSDPGRRTGRIKIGREQISRPPRTETNRRVRISRQGNRADLEHLSGPVRINRVQTGRGGPVVQPHRTETSRRVRINRRVNLRNQVNHSNPVQADLVQTNPVRIGLIQLSRGLVVELRREATNRIVRISRQQSRQNPTRLRRRTRTSKKTPLRPAQAMRLGEAGLAVNKADLKNSPRLIGCGARSRIQFFLDTPRDPVQL